MTRKRRRPLLRAGMVGGTAVEAGTKAEHGHRQEHGRAATGAPTAAPAAAPAAPVRPVG